MANLFGKQTENALINFPFSTHHVQREWIYAICEVKKAAAIANFKTRQLPKADSMKIIKACDEILAGKFDDQFVTAALQGGAGTSVNMNVNEVIANIAGLHPIDHVNMSQSTNDVNPSSLKIALIRLTDDVFKSCDQLILALEKKGKEFADILKLGRTHLQDAVPITLGEEFFSFSHRLGPSSRRERLYYLFCQCKALATGSRYYCRPSGYRRSSECPSEDF